MRVVLILGSVVLLIAIGTAEAWISNEQLAGLPGRGRPAFSASGSALTFIGSALSALVFAALGLVLARRDTGERVAVMTGVAVGAGAGLFGGAIRAYLVSDYLAGVLEGFGLREVLAVTLAVFVALSVALSVVAGASLTWLGFRAGRRRLRPRPPR
jgi:hypothetical protein